MKIAVTGKGGVGKTCVTALLARRLASQGREVLAVDADPDTNLAASLDFPSPDEILPIAEMKDLIRERTGAGPNSVGGYFKLNPRVDDLPEKYCLSHDGIRLIVMGMITSGGKGCACPENAFLKTLLGHLLLGPDEDILVDMEAGLEHLGRGTVASVDGLLVVVEPTLHSLDTLSRVLKLAPDLGLTRVWPLANKVASDADNEFFAHHAPGCHFLGRIPFSERIVQAGRGDISLKDAEPDVWLAIDEVLNSIALAVGAGAT